MAAAGFGLSSQPRASKQLPAAPFENMVRITPQRIPMKQRLMTFCIAPRPSFGPHEDAAEILVYANAIAIEYRRAHPGEFDYPVGSKFVKEKFATPTAKQPDVATIMERRNNKGDVSDWRFSIVSLPDKIELPMPGRVSCAGCHQEYKDTGYVSNDSENALKQYLKIE
jgi:hypothetical protein